MLFLRDFENHELKFDLHFRVMGKLQALVSLENL